MTFKKGEITGNTATEDGGGIYIGPSKTVQMNGGAVLKNTAGNNGGGVFISSNANFALSQGGYVSGNTATGYGNGVYVKSNFTIQGGSYVDESNDVYLKTYHTYSYNDEGVYTATKHVYPVYIAKDLTNHSIVAVITPESYEVGLQVLDYSSRKSASATTTLEDEYKKFKLSDETYTIASDGTLQLK